MFWAKHRRIILWIVYILFFLHAAIWYCLGYHGIGHLGFGEIFTTLKTGVVTAGTIFTILVLIHAVFFGGIFCGWFCHWGITQDAAAWLMKKCGINPVMRHIDSKMIPWAWFIILLAQVVFYWWFNGFPTEFSFNMSNTEVWSGVPRAILMICMTTLISGFILIFLFGERAFCRSICTFRLWFSWLEKFAPYKIRKTQNCATCSHECTSSCFMDINVAKQIETTGYVNSNQCVKCFKCVDACPHSVLAPTFKKNEYQTELDTVPYPSQFDVGTSIIQVALAIVVLNFLGFTIGGNMSLSAGFLLGFMIVHIWHDKKISLFEGLVTLLAVVGLFFANDLNDISSLIKGILAIAVFIAIAKYVGFKKGFEYLEKVPAVCKAPRFLVVLAVVLALYTGGMESYASLMINKAKAAFENKDYATYSEIMGNWAEYHNDRPSVYFNLAKTNLLFLKNYDKALLYAIKSLDISYREDLALQTIDVFLDGNLPLQAKKLAEHLIDNGHDSSAMRDRLAASAAALEEKKARVLGK